MIELSFLRCIERKQRILLGMRETVADDFSRGLAEVRDTETEERGKIWVQRNGKWRVGSKQRYWWE